MSEKKKCARKPSEQDASLAKEKRTRKPKNPNLRCKAYKFRLYPTKKQIGKLEWTLRRCKELYNAGATSTYLLTLSEATNKEVCW